MVTINSQKMSKSLGNIVTIEQALKTWGMNPLRLYCLSVHYPKPLDYTDDLLKESVQRWRQIETCHAELQFASGSEGDAGAVRRLCEESMKAFEAAMDDDMNTSLALTEFLKLVTQLNQYAAADRLTKDMADAALPTLHKIMDILGLKAIAASKQEREDIEKLVNERNRLRAEKKFKEADEIRKKLLERSVELLDHRGRTVWVKRERLE
jgi:cysteinyl-tRNA synthetase